MTYFSICRRSLNALATYLRSRKPFAQSRSNGVAVSPKMWGSSCSSQNGAVIMINPKTDCHKAHLIFHTRGNSLWNFITVGLDSIAEKQSTSVISTESCYATTRSWPKSVGWLFSKAIAQIQWTTLNEYRACLSPFLRSCVDWPALPVREVPK